MTAERDDKRALTVSADELRTEIHGQRLDALEARAGACEDRWARLQGVDERNGRLGRIDVTIGELRADVGTAEARKQERQAAALVNGTVTAWKKRIAAFAALVLGGGGYAVYAANNASVSKSARIEQRIESNEKNIDRLFDLCREPRPSTGGSP